MTAVRVVPVVDDHLVDPLAGDLRNAGSPFDKLTARRHPPDAAFMSLPEGSDPPTDQGSALWCLCDLHMPLGGVKQAAKALVRELILVQRASSQ